MTCGFHYLLWNFHCVIQACFILLTGGFSVQSLTMFLLSFPILYSAKGIIVNGRAIHMQFIKSYLGASEFLSSSIF